MKKTSILFCILVFWGRITAQVTLTSSDLPIVIINTNGLIITDEPKITADMAIVNNGIGQRNNITDAYNEYNGKIGIEIRGQSSQSFPMLSYTIELRDELGTDIEVPLFGMPKESDWVLYAPYTDKTLMHNVLAYTISNSLGHWAAHCKFVEVILNGDYVGVYVLMEKIKRDNDRVDIQKMAPEDIAGDAVTGGYIFSIDKQANGWFSTYHPNNNPNAYIQFSYVYPKLEDIVPEQEQYLAASVSSFEDALAGSNFQDPVNGFRKYADENSFIDYLIVNEVSRNVDGYRLSSYFHKDRNSINNKIFAGPVWDYDLSFRNADYCDGSLTTGWAYDFNSVCPGDYFQLPFWWKQFMQDTAFKANLLCRWKEVRKTVLSNEHLFKLIDSVNTVVAEGQVRHFTKWPILGTYVWPNPQPIPDTYAGEISILKSWLTSRMQWLDDNMPKVGICTTWPSAVSGTIILNMPNPVTNFYGAQIQSKENQRLNIRVIDIMGRVVISSTLQAKSGANTFPEAGNLNRLSKGIYFIQILNDRGEKIVRKIIRL